MYQSSYYQPQQSGQSQQHYHLQEQDAGNLVLNELKRVAREYTTAALEATHPAIRQTFATVTQHTLQDQAELFNVLSQMQGYGQIKMATQQEVQQELQQQLRKAEQLQNLVQQAVQGANASSYAYQAQQQQPSYGQNASYQQPAHTYQQPSQGYQTSYVASASGYGQIGSPSYGPSTSITQAFGLNDADNSTVSQEEGTLKSSVSGTDNQDYFSAQQAQDYTSNQYSSSAASHETYGSHTPASTSGRSQSQSHQYGSNYSMT
ncbi:spore coat protein [Paenibacillus cremeus]|uniref:Spore coat protein n=1 Tax=Paenibacillus cremeus TaxID=2163881 RepID=A0A559KB72_9BACL|nr:spore coat protein [Paenibacillus cremeus]TVY09375.1 spore coat protein [Paenibacillus cremeus]